MYFTTIPVLGKQHTNSHPCAFLKFTYFVLNVGVTYCKHVKMCEKVIQRKNLSINANKTCVSVPTQNNDAFTAEFEKIIKE